MVLLVDELEVAGLGIVLDREGRTCRSLLIGREGSKELLDLCLISRRINVSDDDHAL